ncbi:MAG: hypothetical protein ABIQ11_03615 [Saprospiraceae bacterium]
MKYKLMIAAILFFVACVATKQPAAQHIAREYFILYPEIKSMDIDGLGNLFVLDEDDRLTKFDSTGQIRHHVINPNLGSVHSVDIGNPFKVMVFYRDQQTIVLYDRTLSELQRIRLADWEVKDITATGLSSDNAIWIFDGTNKVLRKMDDKGNAILTSDPFDMIRPPSMRPDYIYDVNHYLLLKEVSQPMAVFDDFAHYIQPLNDIGENFSLTDQVLIYPSGAEIRLFDIAGLKYQNALPVEQKMTDFRVHYFSNRIYGQDDKGIFILDVKE